MRSRGRKRDRETERSRGREDITVAPLLVYLTTWLKPILGRSAPRDVLDFGRNTFSPSWSLNVAPVFLTIGDTVHETREPWVLEHH